MRTISQEFNDGALGKRRVDLPVAAGALDRDLCLRSVRLENARLRPRGIITPLRDQPHRISCAIDRLRDRRTPAGGAANRSRETLRECALESLSRDLRGKALAVEPTPPNEASSFTDGACGEEGSSTAIEDPRLGRVLERELLFETTERTRETGGPSGCLRRRSPTWSPGLRLPGTRWQVTGRRHVFAQSWP